MIQDIESFVDIPDYSIYIIIAISAILLTIVIIIFLILFKKKEKSEFEEYLEKYKNIDLSNSKKSAYLITKYTTILARNKKSKEIKEQLDEELKRYKYKKDVPGFDDKIKGLYNLFLEVVTNE